MHTVVMYISITVIGPAATNYMHPVTQQDVSQYWSKIFAFCYLYYKTNQLLNTCLHCQGYSTLVQKVMGD